ncbi:RagB/SusD family nutrient uptake outer membrane protein [Tunicatimonas pelagia]|uniref:RagB/SusD family nutrient uptake outer membrane protein n=1 Tax=Tunicatimonas pelagia TaxID=931531 RepID=UPI002665112C|nr:RagB/SusD family nutrient uptake outer membrane protein [Tunicatimonas pelagia]WKN44787.1 RagB/SusD family nutrient uptake outer membrane protein [Tunicatimonas pelagia]
MKITRIIALSLVAVISVTVACQDSFLDVAPAGSLSQTELSSQQGLEGSLIATYAMLLGRGGFYTDASNWFWGGVLGGDANKGSDPGDQSQVNEIQLYAAQTNNASVEDKYESTFEGVARANATLALIELSEGAAEEAETRIAAEARFLRGHYYFDLKRNFDDVPYVDETWDEITLIPNDQDLWPMIEMDLQFAFDNLPEVQTAAGRANKWAAGAYLGKVLLFQGKHEEAKPIFDEVIANGVTATGESYALLDNYSDLFRSTNDNNSETVFSVQASANTGTVNNANPAMVLNFPHGSSGPERPGGCCGFNQPSFELANSYRTTTAGLPLLDGSYNNGANALENDFGLSSVDAFTPDAGPVDPRLDHAIGRRGIPFLDWGPHPGRDWIRNQPNGGPYSPKKFMYYKEGDGIENDVSSWTPGYTAVNYYIIRYADVLLMAAEVEAELGNLGAALNLVNQVRARAQNDLVSNEDGSPAANYVIELYPSFGSQEQAIEAVRFERKLELSGEGHRFYDLVRWGIAESTLDAYIANERQFLSNAFAGADFTSEQDEYLPIPQNEIDLIGEDILSQNPGY